MTSSKTKDFKFNLDNKNLLKAFDEKICLQKKLGRPLKKDNDKLSKQVTVKFKPDEMDLLQDIYHEHHSNEYSFGNFLRLTILNQLSIK